MADIKRNGWGIPPKSSAEIRRSFIDFFSGHGHTFVPSSPVVPHDDPTLLFINSGMNQFKGIFLGDLRSGLKRAVNSQKCLRVSGKHNDLDEVGRDTYHHTFFEMLGNWSFGDYYKKEAIVWSWQLLTEVWQLPKNRLFATVFENDDEAEEIWRQLTDIEHSHILRFGEKSNFWEMGEVGPCGPCSEIHFDMGDLNTQMNTFADPIQGVNGPNARYIEIWNNVFMQYERLGDGQLKPLKLKHVDTGMGFERICSIIQGSGSNYETDLFAPLLSRIAELTGHPYEPGTKGTPHRVIADHLRALTFAIADGATPGNEGRGYVLRRILRRASRFSQGLDQKGPFIFKLVPTLVEIMGEAFPEIRQRQDFIAQVVESEEARFMRTLRDGLSRFGKISAEIKSAGVGQITGQDVFLLYDTYGFPADLTGLLAEEQGLSIDHAGFDLAMQEQRERARSAAKFNGTLALDEGWTVLDPSPTTRFVGYENLTSKTKVTRYQEIGDEILVCLEASPFYAESGGQVGDTGVIRTLGLTHEVNHQGKSGTTSIITPRNVVTGVELRVLDTFKVLEMHIHKCALVNGLLTKESLQSVEALVDARERAATVSHHSVTHLLHEALRQVLGAHVTQQGSRVAPEGLRFDFTHPKALTSQELILVENLVNKQICANDPVKIAESSIEQAKSEGAMALFGEKYGDIVRHVKMGGFSHELCGGIHARATGDIGYFKIISESSIASGIRRIEAAAGFVAIAKSQEESRILVELSRSLKAKPIELVQKVADLEYRNKDLDRELKAFREERANRLMDDLIRKESFELKGAVCLIQKLDSHQFPKSSHQGLMESLAGKLSRGVAVLTQVENDTLSILVVVGQELRNKLKAGDIVKDLSQIAGGKGGGRPDRAQAGSKFPEKEPQVLKRAREVLTESLA